MPVTGPGEMSPVSQSPDGSDTHETSPAAQTADEKKREQIHGPSPAPRPQQRTTLDITVRDAPGPPPNSRYPHPTYPSPSTACSLAPTPTSICRTTSGSFSRPPAWQSTHHTRLHLARAAEPDTASNPPTPKRELPSPAVHAEAPRRKKKRPRNGFRATLHECALPPARSHATEKPPRMAATSKGGFSGLVKLPIKLPVDFGTNAGGTV